MAESAHRVTLIPGDGIGPEVTEATVIALEATGVVFEWDRQRAGAAAHEREGEALPGGVIASIRERGVALKGPIATPTGVGYRSVNLALRRELGLYVGIRPCRAIEGVHTAFPRTDIVVVRMLREDLYEGIEYAPGAEDTAALRAVLEETRGARAAADAGFTIKPLSRSESARVARRAFEYAVENGRSRVTAVHKATVMRHTDGLFLEGAREVAEEFPGIDYDERLVDNACGSLVSRPEAFDVLLLPMLYGDIASDIGAGLIGGLGLAPGVNLGDDCAVFEPVHGSAPRLAGRNVANPLAMILTGEMLLRRIGEGEAADRLAEAVAAVVREGRHLSYDLTPSRGESSASATSEVAEAVAARLHS